MVSCGEALDAKATRREKTTIEIDTVMSCAGRSSSWPRSTAMGVINKAPVNKPNRNRDTASASLAVFWWERHVLRPTADVPIWTPSSKLLAAGAVVEGVEEFCEALLTVGLEVSVWYQTRRNALRSQCWIGSRTLLRTGRSTWMSRVRKVSSLVRLLCSANS